VDGAVELFGQNKADSSDGARIALSHAAGTTSMGIFDRATFTVDGAK